MTFSFGLDLFPLLAGLLAAVSCGILGNFLVLRRLSLMGDAISHSVLPGLVIAFLISATRSPAAMFIGAAASGILTVILVELVKRLGRIEPGAAMGVVFSLLFALGVLLIERAAVRHVDLDADCVLYGQLETLVWFGAPQTWNDFFRIETLQAVPRQVTVLAVTCLLAILLVTLFFKELRIAAFDPELATAQGFDAGRLHYLLMVFVAIATVASFEAVGSILVIAMLIGPAATARLLTDRLVHQVYWSVVIALVTGFVGYFAASALPGVWGRDSVSAAGMIATVSGLGLTLAIFFAPQYGVLAKWRRRRQLERSVVIDDLLAALYRLSERGEVEPTEEKVRVLIPARLFAVAKTRAIRRGWVEALGSSLRLTAVGHKIGSELVRRHRLWESYLVTEAGLAPERVHQTAEQLEHVLVKPATGPDTDPHGRPIP